MSPAWTVIRFGSTSPAGSAVVTSTGEDALLLLPPEQAASNESATIRVADVNARLGGAIFLIIFLIKSGCFNQCLWKPALHCHQQAEMNLKIALIMALKVQPYRFQWASHRAFTSSRSIGGNPTGARGQPGIAICARSLAEHAKTAPKGLFNIGAAK